MNDTVKDAIAADLAELAQVSPTPLEPFGYGVDLSCIEDVSETLEEVDAFSPIGIVQALLRRLSTPRGALIDDPSYGLDLRGMLNRGVAVRDLVDLSGQIRSEILKDDRVDVATVSVAFASAATTLRVSIRVTPFDTSLRDFSFTFAVVSGQLLLEGIQ